MIFQRDQSIYNAYIFSLYIVFRLAWFLALVAQPWGFPNRHGFLHPQPKQLPPYLATTHPLAKRLRTDHRCYKARLIASELEIGLLGAVEEKLDGGQGGRRPLVVRARPRSRASASIGSI